MKIKLLVISIVISALIPSAAFALQILDGQNNQNVDLGFSAQAYAVVDLSDNKILAEKNFSQAWPPASLTKLVSAMVVLDMKPNLTKSVAMVKKDEVGGARLATKVGIKYKIKDLFYASMVASANNAVNALARSTGLTREKFVEKMNIKAKELGAVNTVFYEPTGINEKNQTTAEDYVKIAKAAYEYPEIADASSRENYTVVSTSNKKYTHRLKNTNKLLKESSFSILGKTGYLEESKYNFASVVTDKFGNKFSLVLLGSDSPSLQFREIRELAGLGTLIKSFKTASGIFPGAEKNIN